MASRSLRHPALPPILVLHPAGHASTDQQFQAQICSPKMGQLQTKAMPSRLYITTTKPPLEPTRQPPHQQHSQPPQPTERNHDKYRSGLHGLASSIAHSQAQATCWKVTDWMVSKSREVRLSTPHIHAGPFNHSLQVLCVLFADIPLSSTIGPCSRVTLERL